MNQRTMMTSNPHSYPRLRREAAMLMQVLLLALAEPALAQTGSYVQWGGTQIQFTNAPAASERFVAVAAGDSHSLALRADGSLVQWGGTQESQGNNAPANSERFVAVRAGRYHSLALRADGSMVQWGRTSDGQANNAPAASERFVAIAAGWGHCLALRADGSLAQWGRTTDGQGNNAPAASERFVVVVAGSYHSLALRADGSLVQWGRTSEGQANNAPAASERFVAVAAGSFHNLALRADGSLVQWGATNNSQGSDAPGASERFILISAGQYHNLALRTDGSLYLWGQTWASQGTGLPAASERFAAVAAGGYHSLALRGSPAPGRLAFTYQGVLTGVPGGGSAVDLRFSLWTGQSGGQQRGVAVTHAAVPLSPRGLFSAELDFGFLDPSVSPWLQIEVAQPGSGAFTALSPMQRLSNAPMATLAGSAAFAEAAATAATAATAQSVPWTGLTGVPAGFADGIDNTGDDRWADLPSGLGYIGPGGTNYNGIRLTHGTLASSWDLIVGGQANSFAGGFAVAEAGSAKLVVQATSGNVGIGTTMPTALLSVNGTANKPGGGSWATFSDRRLKHDITPLEGSLEKLLKLQGVSFVYDDPQSINELPGRRIGMVAQEVEQVFPDWVATGPSGFKSLTFRGFEALTVEALRELKEENNALRRELAELRAEFERDELRTRLERLEALVSGSAGQSPTDDPKR